MLLDMPNKQHEAYLPFGIGLSFRVSVCTMEMPEKCCDAGTLESDERDRNESKGIKD